MKIKVVNSKEIDRETWDMITNGFNKSFERSKTANEFIEYYQNTVLGYSFHALAYNEENILVGSTTIIPQHYLLNGIRQLFGLSGGSFVLKEFRNDIFIFHDMYVEIRKYCQTHGVKAIVGVPNKNSYKYIVKLLGFVHLFDLKYYAIPMKLGNILKSKNKLILNITSTFFCKTMVYFNTILSIFYETKCEISPVNIEYNDSFKNRRFKLGYQIINANSYFVAYKVVVEDGVKTAYLLEYRKNEERSYKSLSYAIKEINKREQFDLILFIGTINHFQCNLFRIPKKKEPKPLPFTIDYLEGIDEGLKVTLMKNKNWDFSLVNFDVR